MLCPALDGAHVNTSRHLNPVAVSRLGLDAAWLRAWWRRSIRRTSGRLTLIHRFGAKDVAAALPKAIEAVRQTGQSVLWVCDPMPATPRPTRGIKGGASRISSRNWIWPSASMRSSAPTSAAHIELTGDDVTECTAVRAG